jgi:large-conductance mechanosensitive channel
MIKTASKFVIAALMFSFTVIACNNEKKEDEKKEPVQDTTTVAPAPADTTQMDKDTADTRPVKPID